MKKRIKNLIKTEHRRVVAKLMIGMLLAGIPTVAGLSDIAFADDMAIFDDECDTTFEEAWFEDTDFEAVEDTDTETVELSGVEEEENGIITLEDEESSDGEYTGMLYDDIPMSGYFNDWNKYHRLKYGDKVTAIPIQKRSISDTGEISYYGANDISLLGGYDNENNCWYGVAMVPDYDTYSETLTGWKYNEGSAIVRIDGVSNIEIGKEYEATYLYDCNLYFGLDELRDYPYTVQYKDGRIYIFTSWKVYGGLNDVSNFVNTAITKYGVRPTHCQLWLLYSTDIYGNDIRLHYRFAELDQDNNMRTPWYIPNKANKYQRKIEGSDEYEYVYKGIVWHDNKWQGAFEKSKSYVYDAVVFEPLPDNIISEDDIGGFLTASDQWFDKRNSMGEEVFMYGGKWYHITDECCNYLRQWLFDNGYKKSVYPEKLPRNYLITQNPEYLEKFGEPTDGTGGYTEEEAGWIYPDGTITEGKGKKEEKEDDPKNPDITEDDIPAPVTVEYKLGPVVVKNQLDIKQLVSANSATKMKYKVDNRKIAKVSSKGIMTGKNAGYVTVTGYAKVRNSSNKKKWVWKETGSVKVEVTRPSFKGLDKNTLTIKFKGEPVDLNGYITNESPMTPTFSVNSGGMAKVSNDGIIEATGEGKAKVTVMFGKYKMKLKVIVTP